MSVTRVPHISWTSAESGATQAQDQTPQVQVAGLGDVIPIIYGEVITSGKLFMVGNNDKGELIMAVVWCVGEISSISQVYLNGEPAHGSVKIKNYVGSPNQAIDPTLAELVKPRTYADPLIYIAPDGRKLGLAYTVLTIPATAISTVPTVTAKIFGRRMNWNNGWSNVPVNYIHDLMTDPTIGAGRQKVGSSSLVYKENIIEYDIDQPREATFFNNAATYWSLPLTQWAQYRTRKSIFPYGVAWQGIEKKVNSASRTRSFTLKASTFYTFSIYIEMFPANQYFTGGWYTAGSWNATGLWQYRYATDAVSFTTPPTNTDASVSMVNLGTGPNGGRLVRVDHTFSTTHAGATLTANYMVYPMGTYSAPSGATGTNIIHGVVMNVGKKFIGQRRRKTGIVLAEPRPIDEWVEVLRQYAACTVATEGNNYKLTPLWEDTGDVDTLTKDNIVKDTLILGYKQADRSPNVISVSYADSNEVSYIPPGIASGSTPWREERISLPGLALRSQAYRYAKERYNSLWLAPLKVQFRVLGRGLRYSVGDLIKVIHPLGLDDTAKERRFRIISLNLVGAGLWEVEAEEFHPDIAVFGDIVSETGLEYVAPTQPVIVKPSNLILKEEYVVNNVVPPKSHITASWMPVIDPNLVGYEVLIEHNVSGQIESTIESVILANWRSAELATQKSYTIKVRAVYLNNVRSDWTAGAIFLVGRTTTLKPPLGVRTTGGGNCFDSRSLMWAIRVTWVFPTGDGPEIVATEVWYSKNSNTTDLTRLGIYAYPTDNALMEGLKLGDRFYFFIRFKDRQGRTSSWHANNGTPGMPSCNAEDIIDYIGGQITESTLHNSLITKIDNKLGPNDPAIVQMRTRIDETYGEWTVKVQSGNVIAGIGLMADQNGDGGVRSAVIVRADRFAIGHPSDGTKSYPFIVENGVAYIKQAAIHDAYITTAKIKDLSVINGKIGWNAVTTMASGWNGWTGELGADQSTTLNFNVNFAESYGATIIVQVDCAAMLAEVSVIGPGIAQASSHNFGRVTKYVRLFVDGVNVRTVLLARPGGGGICSWQGSSGWVCTQGPRDTMTLMWIGKWSASKYGNRNIKVRLDYAWNTSGSTPSVSVMKVRNHYSSYCTVFLAKK